jgi:hypothetical protein
MRYLPEFVSTAINTLRLETAQQAISFSHRWELWQPWAKECLKMTGSTVCPGGTIDVWVSGETFGTADELP